MSKLEFDFEPLNKVLDGKEVTKDEAMRFFCIQNTIQKKFSKWRAIFATSIREK